MPSYLKRAKPRPKEDLSTVRDIVRDILEIAKVCERACNDENMLAHGLSCRVRIEKYGG